MGSKKKEGLPLYGELIRMFGGVLKNIILQDPVFPSLAMDLTMILAWMQANPYLPSYSFILTGKR
jgi:hypothetical protein